ncbi:EH signature domain-containing protein [Burkholderia pseudomallei]|uniref:EH signature domain-containing protein n=1 Tax=Burkholderia pseudomallei TaxID=28450 RepID=UPI001604DCC3|nr:EH signature domain-containing protein [Burkholderia pseudomallei]
MTELQRQIEELTRQIMGRTPSAPEDAILEAVQRFAQEPRFRDSRDALLVSLGCDRPIGKTHYRLIEDVSRFPLVLTGVDRFRKHLFVFKDCYKGLLDTYLVYHPETKGGSPKARPNWESLRTWLESGIQEIRDPGELEEEWVLELVAHPELFSEEPVESFGRELLENDDGTFLIFQRALGISEASWLIEQLVLAQIHAAGKSRAGVAFYLLKLLPLLEPLGKRNPPVFDLGLTELLKYYHAQSKDTPSIELRDFLLEAWGPPDKTAKGWMLVPEDPFRMAESWFKRHIIQQFFKVLAKEGELEEHDKRLKRKRRLEFWEQYADVVGPVKFALGPHARTSTDERMVAVLELMSGLTLELQGGGDRQNNAFIMRFGEWVVVEFGLENNACFIYRASDVPFERGDTCVSAQAIRHHINTSSGYSSRGPVRLVHVDSGGRTWEETFTDEMQKRGIFCQRQTPARSTTTRWVPKSQSGTGMTQVETDSRLRQIDELGRNASSATTSSAAGSATDNGTGRRPNDFISLHKKDGVPMPSSDEPVVRSPFGKTGNAQSGTTDSAARPPAHRLTSQQETGVKALCGRLGIAWEDFRSKNGNLWVYHDWPHDSRITPQLKQWGFSYRQGKGWWYKDPA